MKEDAISRINKKLKDFGLDSEYNIMSVSCGGIDFYHKQCGSIFNTKENLFFDKKRRCLACEIKSRYNGEFTVIKKLNDSRSNYIIQHKCGYEFKRTYNEYERKGCTCIKCNGFKHWTHDTFIKYVSDIDNEYIVNDSYINCMTKISFTHKKCNNSFLMTPSHFLDGRRCPLCANIDRCISKEHFVNEVNRYVGDRIEIKKYINLNSPVTFIHTKCNKSFTRRANDFLTSLKNKTFSCPICDEISHGEYIIDEILTKNNILFDKQFSFEDCVNKKKLKFDFAILDENRNVIHLIEFDGKQHFLGYNNNVENLLETQKRDKIKDEYCSKNNIHLLRIPYTEIKNIEKILRDNNII